MKRKVVKVLYPKRLAFALVIMFGRRPPNPIPIFEEK